MVHIVTTGFQRPEAYSRRKIILQPSKDKVLVSSIFVKCVLKNWSVIHRYTSTGRAWLNSASAFTRQTILYSTVSTGVWQSTRTIWRTTYTRSWINPAEKHALMKYTHFANALFTHTSFTAYTKLIVPKTRDTLQSTELDRLNSLLLFN
jgi:hypothetical protein